MHSAAFPFESAETRELAFLPLAVRRSLDLLGLHVSLEAWSALSLAERQAWLDASVGGGEAGGLSGSGEGEASDPQRALRARILASLEAAGHTARPVEPVQAASAPWRSSEATAAIEAAASRLGARVEVPVLEALDDLARFALAHLAAKSSRDEAFLAALRHFAVDTCTSF